MTRPPSCLQCTSRHIQGGVDPRGDLFSCTRRGAAPIPVALFWGCYRCICDHVVCMSRCRCCRQCWCSSCVGCLLSSRNVYQLYATREVCDEASERGSEDYMDSVMSKTPPTAKKAVGSGALVVTIAIIPPSKATTPTTAMLDRLT